MQFQIYVPESYTTYEKIEENVWMPTIHETLDEMCKEVEKDEDAYYWQNQKSCLHQHEGLYALRPTGCTVTAENMARICSSDECPPHGWMGQIIRLFPGQKLFFAWLGQNPLTRVFSSLPEELSDSGVTADNLEPGWYAVTPSGLVYKGSFHQTAWYATDLDKACHEVQKNTWLFPDAELHLLPSGKFGISQEGLPKGIKFLDNSEILDWAIKTTESEQDCSCWNHVYERLRLDKLAKGFAQKHGLTLEKQYLLER